MPTIITLDVFSGRPNPTLTLDDNQEAALNERLSSLRKATAERASGAFGGLGYRGVTIQRAAPEPDEQLNMRVHRAVVESGPSTPGFVDDVELERWLTDLARGSLGADVQRHIDQALADEPTTKFAAATAAADGSTCPPCHAADAPAYNPGPWNVPPVLPNNNCYNYANDHVTNTFAQPGRATVGQAANMACPDVQIAAQGDGLVQTGGFVTPLGPGQGWYVALVVWPGNDYHWYRQDAGGCWSHKPGRTAARDVDNGGQKIADPQTCNRGPYTDFCCYMITTRGVTIT